jgi:hypothetical protein
MVILPFVNALRLQQRAPASRSQAEQASHGSAVQSVILSKGEISGPKVSKASSKWMRLEQQCLMRVFPLRCQKYAILLSNATEWRSPKAPTVAVKFMEVRRIPWEVQNDPGLPHLARG